MSDKPLTFLVVEKDLGKLEAATGLLNNMGYFSLLQAEDGVEAWSMIKKFRIDFVISSLDIPEVSGLDLLRVLRSNEEYTTKPFILVARNVTSKLVCQAGRTGVSDIIVFPFSADLFQKKVQSIVEFENDVKVMAVEKKFDQGLELMKIGKYDEAIKTLESISTLHENAEVCFNLGYIKSAKGLYEEALQCFRQATRIDNDHARAYKYMAEAYSHLGKTDESGRCLQKAAEIFMDRKEDGEAEEIFEEIAQLLPETINVYNNLGIIYRRQGKLPQAIKQYQKGLMVHPNDENLYYNLGRAYLECKELALADEAVKRALEINPDFQAARNLAKAVALGISPFN